MRALWPMLFLAQPAFAVVCEKVEWSGASYSVCEVDTQTETLQLFHSDEAGQVFGSFRALEDRFGPIQFAMNAGMYHPDRAPVGLFQKDNVIHSPTVLTDGPGNFGLLPNGVFCIRPNGHAAVMETSKYAADDCRDATQSGPMLVIDGELHPRFIPNGSSKFIRNGVGSSADETRAYFVISNEPVNFHTFGSFFKDHLGLDQALYFDGRISRLFAPELGRDDIGFQLGPMVAVLP